ncbi:MAG: hypothetical protein HONDAALG_03459 [Gammaproteobacteria bacterium]|nr:hypothetical protein [Gammaproteobacteria bacterium]
MENDRHLFAFACVAGQGVAAVWRTDPMPALSGQPYTEL